MTEPSVAPADQLDASARRTPEFMRDFMDAGLGPSTDGLERRQRRLSVQVGALARGDYRGIIDPASAPDGSDDQGAPTAWTPFQTPLALPVQVSGTTNITAHKDPWRLQPQQAQAGSGAGVWTGSLADRIRASLASLQREQDELEAAMAMHEELAAAGTLTESALQALNGVGMMAPLGTATTEGLLGMGASPLSHTPSFASALAPSSRGALPTDMTRATIQLAALQAQRSPRDPATGHLQCLACLRWFGSVGAITQHLAALHQGINAPPAPMSMDRPPVASSVSSKGVPSPQTVADLMSLSGMYPALASQQSWAAQMGLSAASASRGSTGTGFMQVPQGASSAGGMDGKRVRSSNDLVGQNVTGGQKTRAKQHKAGQGAGAQRTSSKAKEPSSKGGVVGTLDASGNLIEKNARPTRVKRSIINHGAKELLHRAHSMEELMAEAAADGHRLQALVDSAHQMGMGGLLVRIKEVAQQQNMLGGAFAEAMEVLESNLLSDHDATVAHSLTRRRVIPLDGAEGELLEYLGSSAEATLRSLVTVAKRELDRHAAQPAAVVAGKARRFVERHSKVLEPELADDLLRAASRIDLLLEDQVISREEVAPSVRGEMDDFEDWFDLILHVGRRRRNSIQVGALAREKNKPSLQRDIRGAFHGEQRPGMPTRSPAPSSDDELIGVSDHEGMSDVDDPPHLVLQRQTHEQGEGEDAAPPDSASDVLSSARLAEKPPRLNPNSSAFVPGGAPPTSNGVPPSPKGVACGVCGEGTAAKRAARAEHILGRHGAAARRQVTGVLQEFLAQYVMLSRGSGSEVGGEPQPCRGSSLDGSALGNGAKGDGRHPREAWAESGGGGADGFPAGGAATGDKPSRAASAPEGGESAGDAHPPAAVWDGTARKPTVAPYAKSQALDDAVVALMEKLKFFQNRKYEQSPAKAQQRRRFVVGLKEVVKAVRSKKVAMVVLANNVESAAGAAGFDEQVAQILSHSEEKGFPTVYALGLKRLGRLMQFRPSWRKAPPKTTAVAVLDIGGAEDLAQAVVKEHEMALSRAVPGEGGQGEGGEEGSGGRESAAERQGARREAGEMGTSKGDGRGREGRFEGGKGRAARGCAAEEAETVEGREQSPDGGETM